MPLPSTDPAPSEAMMARRRRIAYAIMGALFVGVSGWHAFDAHRRGESVWPVLTVLPVMALVVFLTARFLGRPIEGLSPPDARRERAQQLMRRVMPLAIGATLLAVVLRGCIQH